MKRFILASFAALAVVFSLSSCGGGGGTGLGSVSSTTGRAYNDTANGGFEVTPYVEQETGPGLVFIEGGAFVKGGSEQDVKFDWNNIQRTHTVSSFYMDQTEVKNVDYLEYLHWIKRVFNEGGDVENAIYQQALPDTLCWRRRLANNEPYVEYYLRHPAYYTYPVVGVSWVKADEYCKWRTDRVNEQILVDADVLQFDAGAESGQDNFCYEAYLAGLYKGHVKDNYKSHYGGSSEARPVRMEDGLLLPRYRLPSEAEWEYAALALGGEGGNTVDERIWAYKLYPWNGHYLRNDTKRDLGRFMANFKRGRGDMMGIAGDLNDEGSITVPVDSYWPNEFNLYCMAGNVNEWVFDVYRAMNPEDLEDFNPVRGNVFMKKFVDSISGQYQLDSMGRIKYVPMSDEDNKGRYNYTRSYNKNFNDGDIRSRAVSDWKAQDSLHSLGMYNAQGEAMTSLVSDQSRIFKGGGWRDKAYWLSPGNKRFLHEESSRDDLGFRCAMDRMGAPKPGNTQPGR